MAKRLLLILTEFPPSFGGMQAHALALSRWLHSRGYEVEVATYRLEDGPAEIPSLPFPVHRVLSRISYQANVRRLSQLAGQMQADLIYSSTVYYGQLDSTAPVLCRSAGNDVLRPWIAWPFHYGSRLFDVPWVERQLYRRWKQWSWPELLEAILLRRRRKLMELSALSMRTIFANSTFTRELLEHIRVPEDRLKTLPGGVDELFFEPPQNPRRDSITEKFVLLTACRLVPKKGLEVLLDSVRMLAHEFPVELWIAGDGRERKVIESRIRELALEEHVQLLGYVPPARLRDLMHEADAFVLSSREVIDARTGLRDAETMGRVLCEAAACGLPSIATRTGGIPSVVEHEVTGILVEPSDAAALAQAIRQLREQPEQRRQLGIAARCSAEERFAWPVLFEAHEAAIEELLARSEFDRSKDLAGFAIEGATDGQEAFK